MGQQSENSSFGTKIASLGAMLKPLILAYLWLAFIWAQICSADRKDHAVVEVLLMIVFVGSIGLFIKVWFYIAVGVAFAEVLNEDEADEPPPESAVHFIAGRLFEWLKAGVIFIFQAILFFGSLGAVLAFVGYNTLWALGVTMLCGAIFYSFIEFHQKRAAAYS